MIIPSCHGSDISEQSVSTTTATTTPQSEGAWNSQASSSVRPRRGTGESHSKLDGHRVEAAINDHFDAGDERACLVRCKQEGGADEFVGIAEA